MINIKSKENNINYNDFVKNNEYNEEIKFWKKYGRRRRIVIKFSLIN